MNKLLLFKQGLETHVNLEEHKLGQSKQDNTVFRNVVRNKMLQGLAEEVETQISERDAHSKKVNSFKKLFPNVQQKRFDLNHR